MMRLILGGAVNPPLTLHMSRHSFSTAHVCTEAALLFQAKSMAGLLGRKEDSGGRACYALGLQRAHEVSLQKGNNM